MKDWKDHLSGYMQENFGKKTKGIQHFSGGTSSVQDPDAEENLFTGKGFDNPEETGAVDVSQLPVAGATPQPPQPQIPFNKASGLPPPVPAPTNAPTLPPTPPNPVSDTSQDDLQAQLGGYKADMAKYGPEQQMAVEQAILKQRTGFGPNLANAGAGLADALMSAGGGQGRFQENLQNRTNQTQTGMREAMKTAQTGKTAQIEQEMKLSSIDPTSPLSKIAQKAHESTLLTAGVPKAAIPFMPASLIAEIGNKNVTLLDDRIKIDLEGAYRKAGLDLQAQTLAETIKNRKAEHTMGLSKDIQGGGFFNTVAGMIPGSATNIAKKAQMQELSNLTKEGGGQSYTPDVVSYAKTHGITPEQAKAIKDKRTGGQ
jgi:hypothetical protein